MAGPASQPRTLNPPTPGTPPATDTCRYAIRLLPGRVWPGELEADWKHLASSFDEQHLANFLDWHRSYVETLAVDPDAVFCCVVSRDDAVLAIVPLEKRSRRVFGVRLRSLQLPNHPRMVLGQPLLIGGEDPAQCAAALIAQLGRVAGLHWDYLYLPNLAADATAGAFASAADFIRTCDRVGGCCYCPVVPYEALPGRLSRSFRQALRRNRKKLARLPEVTFTTASTMPELKEAYPRFLEVEASGWKGEHGTRTALNCDARFRSFHAKLLEHFAARGKCEIHLMWLGETPIAGQLTLTAHDTTYVLKIGYDQRCADLSPGNMLFDYLFKRCGEDPSAKYVNLCTDMPWMDRWKPLRHELLDLCLYKRTIRGRLAWAYWRLRLRGRSLALARLRPLYRTIRRKNKQRTKPFSGRAHKTV